MDAIKTDLEHCCRSTPLLDLSSGIQAGELPVLDCTLAEQLDHAQWQTCLEPPFDEHSLAHRHSSRLGLRCEAMWQLFIERHPEAELLASNLQVQEQGRTLGEFDLIYFCKRRKRAVHLEIAHKFYLQHSEEKLEGEALSSWIGPCGRDRLDIKWKRLLEHQCRLSDTEAGSEALKSIGLDGKPLLRELAFAGQLFYALEELTQRPKPKLPPLPINPEHNIGYWMPWTNFLAQREKTATENWVLLERRQWLGPQLRQNCRTLEVRDIEQHFQDSQRALMLANFREDREQWRLMLCHPNWPELERTAKKRV